MATKRSIKKLYEKMPKGRNARTQ